jgi:hypothetical protein
MMILRTIAVVLLLGFTHTLMAACLIDDFDDRDDDGWIRCGDWGDRKTPVWDPSDGRYCLSMSEPLKAPPPPPLTIAAEWTKTGEQSVYANGCVTVDFQAGTEEAGTWNTHFVIGLRADCKHGGYKAMLGPSLGRISLYRRLELLADNLDTTFEQGEHYRAEFCAIGSQLSLDVWPRSQPKPESPQLRAENGLYTTGNIGIGVFVQNDNRGPIVKGCFDNIRFDPAPSCASDLNCDRVVDSLDLRLVADAWGGDANCASSAAEDIDSNCAVGFGDAVAVAKSWGTCPTPLSEQ